MEYVSPIDERIREPEPLASRPAELAGRRIALLDISKARGAQFLDRLEELLRERGITQVTVVGLATDYCVKNTALDALRAGFAVTADTNAVRGVEVEPGDSERALAEVRAAGGVMA